MGMPGPAAKVVDDYLEKVEPMTHGGTSIIGPEVHRSGTGEAKLTRAVLTNAAGEPVDRVRFKEPFRVTLTFDVKTRITDAVIAVMILTNEAGPLLSNHSTEQNTPALVLEPGQHEFSANIDVTLLPGEFVIAAGMANTRGANIDFVDQVLRFPALTVPRADGEESYPWDSASAFVRPNCEWDLGETAPAPATVGQATQ